TERLDNGCDTLRAYMSPVDQLYFTHADPLELLGSEEECNQVAAKIIDAYKYTTTSRFSGFMDTYLPLVRYIAIDSLESMAEDMQSSIDEEEEDEV
ncbi:MAG: hypothetical protein IJ086_10710, partial [Clostridium sp.]|nr:hypothetical protein [Clostridium sp.]